MKILISLISNFFKLVLDYRKVRNVWAYFHLYKS